MEILTQGLVLDGIPADTDAQPQTTATEHIDFRRLLGHQGSLTLRQDEDGRHQLQPLGNASEIAHEGQGFVEIALVGIRKLGHLRMELRISAQDVVEEADVGIPQILRGLDKVAQSYEISSKFGERDSDADVHTDLLIASAQRPGSTRRAGSRVVGPWYC